MHRGHVWYVKGLFVALEFQRLNFRIRFNKDWIIGISSYSGTYKVSQKIPFCFEKNVVWSMGV